MSTTRLHALVHNPHAPIGEIAAWLDSLSLDARWRELSTLDRPTQRLLYQKAAAHQPLTLADFAAADLPPRREVIHRGRNTLPGLEKLRFFEKRFCRPERAGERLFGYNEGFTRRLIGPGYFVAVPTAGRPEWAARGAVVVDYFQIPDEPVVASWPQVVPNSHGLQRLVFHHTRDFMRRISQGVTVGAAFKEEKPLDHYFILQRQD